MKKIINEDIDLLFIPQHDPAFPHSALPHLKSYVKEQYPDLNIKCIDLNIELYQRHILGKNYKCFLDHHRKNFERSSNINHAIKIALDFEHSLANKCNEWLLNWHGYNITLRNLDTPFDRNNIDEIITFSESITPFDDLFLNYLKKTNASLIGVNLSVEDQVLPLFRFLKLCRTKYPKIKIVIGGAYLSRVYPVMLKDFEEYFDFLILREGEESLCQIIGHLFFKKNIINNSNKIYTSGSIKQNIFREFKEDNITEIHTESVISQDFSDYDLHDYLILEPMLPILGSRKCYWGNCSFCTIHESWDPAKRTRNVQQVLDEILFYQQTYSISNFRFIDEASPPSLIFDLSEKIIEAKLSIGFEIYAIAEKRFNDIEKVRSLGLAGCRQVYIGIESMDKNALKLMKKHINDISNMDTILENFSNSGMHVYAFLLFGFPGVSDDADKQTISYVKNNHNIHTVGIGSYVPVIGSSHVNNNKEHYRHMGGLTEDVQPIKLNDLHYIDSSKQIKKANIAVHDIYTSRNDLAITTLLSDESRYALTGKFGPKFAKKLNDSTLVRLAIDKAVRERITRS